MLWVSLKLNWLCCLLSHLWQHHRVANEVKQDAIQHVFMEVDGGISSCQSPATLRYLSPRRVAIHHIKSCSGLNYNEAFDRMAFYWDQGVFILSASNKFLAFLDAKVYWCVYYRCILISQKGGNPFNHTGNAVKAGQNIPAKTWNGDDGQRDRRLSLLI